MAYANRAIGYTLTGKDVEAQQDVERVIGLGLDRKILESKINSLKQEP